jgi:uncharacterized protein
VVVATLPIGGVLLGLAFAQPPGQPAFYLFTVAVAATWLAGAVLSGPLSLGPRATGGRRAAIGVPVATGLAAAGAVVATVVLVRQVPALRGFVDDLLVRVRGPAVPTALVTLANGGAEEVFFRGAVFAALGPRRPVALSTAVYASVTVATGNPALVVAAVALGVLFGLQRRASGGILAPLLTHLTWSAALLATLPRLATR